MGEWWLDETPPHGEGDTEFWFERAWGRLNNVTSSVDDSIDRLRDGLDGLGLWRLRWEYRPPPPIFVPRGFVVEVTKGAGKPGDYLKELLETGKIRVVDFNIPPFKSDEHLCRPEPEVSGDGGRVNNTGPRSKRAFDHRGRRKF